MSPFFSTNKLISAGVDGGKMPDKGKQRRRKKKRDGGRGVPPTSPFSVKVRPNELWASVRRKIYFQALLLFKKMI